ncbi:hypothetical protein [Priestia aryabhattai]|uniref:hypothetical protein n=1 Tax=Priestia aryabhattai TaxID=412384 RepID=UPI001AD9972F|nr:hypothetical protein [Priestia aryabhattai]QTL47257.1 hypothetical protein J5Z55_14210 [Priestia aryabhattai]
MNFERNISKKTGVDVKNIYTESYMQTKKFIVKYIIDGKHGFTAFYYCYRSKSSMKEFEDLFSELQADMISSM